MRWHNVAGAVTLAIAVCWASQARAGEDSWPGGVYAFAQLDEARQVARDTHKPLTFLYTEKNSTCPLCRDANKDVVNRLGRKSVVVYINSRDTSLRIPDVVSAALSSKSAGQYIPKTVITDERVSRVIFTLPYVDRRVRQPLLLNAEGEIEKYSRE